MERITSIFFVVVLIALGTHARKFQAKESLSKEGRMVGGTAARAREFPYVVSIRTYEYDNLGHFCGGALISPNLIVTAGACTDPASPKIDEIVAGTLNRVEPYPGQQVRKPGQIIPHPGYVFPPYDDISLIFLDEPFVFNENITAIALPQANQSTYPYPVVLAGWGNEQYNLPMSDVLMRVTTDTYSDQDCQTFMGEPVPDELLCAGTDEGGISACQGDAGAPLVSTFGGTYIAAVLSHFPCPKPDCCGVAGPMDHNPEVAFYLDWIMEQSKLYGGGL